MTKRARRGKGNRYRAWIPMTTERDGSRRLFLFHTRSTRRACVLSADQFKWFGGYTPVRVEIRLVPKRRSRK